MRLGRRRRKSSTSDLGRSVGRRFWPGRNETDFPVPLVFGKTRSRSRSFPDTRRRVRERQTERVKAGPSPVTVFGCGRIRSVEVEGAVTLSEFVLGSTLVV